MKIHSVGTLMCHADRQDKANSRLFAIL